MEGSILSLIRTSYPVFSASQKQVADFVLKNPDRVMISSMSDLAQECGVSEPTIMRFLHKLKYDSYQVFRVNIAQELGTGSTKNLYSEEIQEGDGIDVIKNKVLTVTAQSLMDCTELIDDFAVDRMAQGLLAADRIMAIGLGGSYAEAWDFAHKMQRLGLPAFASNDSHMINIMCTNLCPKDILVVFSHSGESREILDAVAIARKNGASIAAITSYPNSKVVKECNWSLLSTSYETNYRSDAMTSRIIQMTLTDILYICMAQRMGAKAEQSINLTRLAVAKNKR